MDAGLRKAATLFDESVIVKLAPDSITKRSGSNKQSFRDRQEAQAWLDEC
jgi:hypothetical protein